MSIDQLITPPKIMRAVEDPTGQRWFCFGSDERSTWFSAHELRANARAVFDRLDRVGLRVITRRSEEAFRSEVEKQTTFEQAEIAGRPGWTFSGYVHGNGNFQRRPHHADAVLALQPDSKFDAVGSLEDWQNGLGPIVRDQPLPLFALAYSLIGPLLSLSPPDYQNPILEIVGEPHVGKSALAIAAGSLWGGNPDSGIGFGVSWDQTQARLDEAQHHHRDGLLFLDEANHTGMSKREQGEYLRSAVFKFTETSARQRFGDSFDAQHARLCVLSTSNEPLSALVGNASGSDRAVLSRVLSLRADRAYGILDIIPEGFATARDAVEALHAVSNSAYGTAGPAFIQKLISYKDSAVREAIAKALRRYQTRYSTAYINDPRIAKIAALTCVAGRLAQQFDVLPRDWGSLDKAISSALQGATSLSANCPTALERVRSYVARHQAKFVAQDNLSRPLDHVAFATAPGFWLDEGRKCVIPTASFQDHFPDHTSVLAELDECGRLDRDRTKFSKKAPACFCERLHRSRGYFVNITESVA